MPVHPASVATRVFSHAARHVAERVASLGAVCCLAMASPTQAACLAPGQGDLAPLEDLAFRDPGPVPAVVAKLVQRADMQNPQQRATLAAIAGEALRQVSKEEQALAQAEAGLTVLAPDTTSPLALRLRMLRAVLMAGEAQALAELNQVLAAAANNPLAQGCALRDRGWLLLNGSQLEQALADLIRSHALLQAHSDRNEQAVAMGRLSNAYVQGGDFAAALKLVDETIAHFKTINAQVRLSTALGRRSQTLALMQRWPEAEAAAREARTVSEQNSDPAGAALHLLSLCRLVGRQNREAEASALCDESLRLMQATDTDDRSNLDWLALNRVELLRSRAPTAAELTELNRAVQNAASSGSSLQGRAYKVRAEVLAKQGDYRAAYDDLQRLLALMRSSTETERVNSQAAMRVRFETDRALAQAASLEQQNQTGRERTVWLAVAAGALTLAVAGLGYALLLNRRHRARLTEVAERDELTRLPNRRKILEYARQQLALSRRRGSTLVIGMVDIDHFKRINDTHGHAGGDCVLRAFGGISHTALRGTDTVGRWGGEEFLLVLPDCPLQAAAAVAERLRSTLGAQAVQAESGTQLRFSVSIGLATADPGETDLDTVLQRADAALYAAKAQGRDRVVVHGQVVDAQVVDARVVDTQVVDTQVAAAQAVDAPEISANKHAAKCLQV